MKRIEIVKVASGYVVNIFTTSLGFMPIRSYQEDRADELNLAGATNFAYRLGKMVNLPVVKF